MNEENTKYSHNGYFKPKYVEDPKIKEEWSILKPLYDGLTITQSVILYHKQKHQINKFNKFRLKFLIGMKILYQNPKTEENRNLNPKEYEHVPKQFLENEK